MYFQAYYCRAFLVCLELQKIPHSLRGPNISGVKIFFDFILCVLGLQSGSAWAFVNVLVDIISSETGQLIQDKKDKDMQQELKRKEDILVILVKEEVILKYSIFC